MNSTKIVIVCLILLTTLFFVGLSLNLIDKPIVGDKPSYREQQAATSKYSWPLVVNNILSPFADSITVEDLSLSNCSRINQGIILNNQNSSCTIRVKGFSETFKKLSLKPNKSSTKLKITFKQSGKPKEKPITWPSNDLSEEKISFVIMGKEALHGQTVATITLDCLNCSDQRNVRITFE